MRKSGFTLIELMVVIAIIAILVALAVPSYQSSIRKSRRSDAQTQLMEFAGTAERIFNQNNSYAAAALPTSTEFYTYSFPVAVTATSYTIKATPKGPQSSDDCGSMTLTQTGVKTHDGSLTECW